jgi:hypothetical protein
MPNKIERLCSVTGEIALTDNIATTPAIPFGAAAGATLFVESVSGATSITWHVMHSATGSAAAMDSDGAVTTAIQAGKAYSLPGVLYAAPFVKAVLDSGTATAVVSLKG